MQRIVDLVEKILDVPVVDLVIAICIIVLFRIFSSSISYIVIRMFRWKAKSPKEIKESAFYNPLRVFITIFGIYLGICFLREPLDIPENVMLWVTRIFKVAVIIAISKGFAQSFTVDAKFIQKIREKSSKKMDDSSVEIILKIVRAIIYVIAGGFVLTELGVDLSGLIAGLGIGGIIITLAAQDTAKNLFGGFVIFLDKPFSVGDWIQMGEYEGNVEEITFRSTRIRLFENSVVNVPNSVISDSSIINWSKMEQRRYKFNLCLDLGTPLEKVAKVQDRITNMLEKHDRIIDDTIIVKFDGITDNGINLLVCSYTDSVDYNSYLEEKEKINYKVMQILREENVNLAYDTKTVYLKNG